MIKPLTIADIERETGISRDTLRIWERRYGFPEPHRNQRSERNYNHEQLERLRLIKQLIDNGMRPGKLARLDQQKLQLLLKEHTDPPELSPVVADLLELIQDQMTGNIEQRLDQLLHQHGLPAFLTEIVAPLNHAVGKSWADGKIGVLDEHMYAEQIRMVLGRILKEVKPAPAAPRVLLTTLPGEQHGIGMLMVACMLGHEGAAPLVAGVQTPLDEIVRGAVSGGCSVVGISCSSYLQRRQITSQLVRLRSMLPREIRLWVGGEGVKGLTAMPSGIQLFQSLNQISTVLQQLASTQKRP
ncbi:MerR family transcriptional regulator [Trichlorobacter lovleyi]|uniref:MerR family transcriptional regulator n=1 Tax=Trichlorobacter lovleyi TaxID=313985 RepID=UPI0023F1810E|nr:MerR family transcriptional regulator [Trichlorobacter lovleyi]